MLNESVPIASRCSDVGGRGGILGDQWGLP